MLASVSTRRIGLAVLRRLSQHRRAPRHARTRRVGLHAPVREHLLEDAAVGGVVVDDQDAACPHDGRGGDDRIRARVGRRDVGSGP